MLEKVLEAATLHYGVHAESKAELTSNYMHVHGPRHVLRLSVRPGMQVVYCCFHGEAKSRHMGVTATHVTANYGSVTTRHL